MSSLRCIITGTFFLMVLNAGFAQSDYWVSKDTFEKITFIKSVKDSLLKSKNHDLRGELMMDLTEKYILYETNDSIQRRMECVLIGMSRFSDSYFFHVFESEFQSFYIANEHFVLSDGSVLKKVNRVLFLLSFRDKEIVAEYYNKAENQLQPNEKKKIKCSNLQRSPGDIDTFVKEDNNASIFFFKAIYSCPAEIEYLRVMRLAFLVKIANE